MPLAVPGRWRAVTIPATHTCVPVGSSPSSRAVRVSAGNWGRRIASRCQPTESPMVS